MKQIDMRAVFVNQFIYRIFKCQLHGFHHILRKLCRQPAEHTFECRNQHLVLHFQRLIGLFQILQTTFDIFHHRTLLIFC